jgi:hypothetical protein
MAILVLFPVLLLLAWAGFALRQVLGGVFRGLLFPVQLWHRLVLRGRHEIRRATLKQARTAACDAWLLPALRRGAGPRWVEKIEWGRTEMELLLPAAPADFPEMNHHLYQRYGPAGLKVPYLLVPSPPRRGPFLESLPHALDLLDEPPSVVFWGAGRKQLALHDSRLGVISAEDPRARAALYHGAAAALVPTIDQDLVTTIAEALHWGCPLVCAGTPALLPWLKPFADTVALFDPAYPESLARAIRQTCEDRDWIHSLQKEAGKALWQRTWNDAARELLQLVRPPRKSAPRPVQGEPMRSNLQTSSGR